VLTVSRLNIFKWLGAFLGNFKTTVHVGAHLCRADDCKRSVLS
jgi:hypothetical protein